MSKSGPIVSVDGDVLVYRTGFAAQTTRYAVTGEEGFIGYYKNVTAIKAELGDDYKKHFKIEKQAKKEPLENALHSCKVQLQSITEATNARILRVYLSGKDNFRAKVSKFLPYKGNRLTPKRRAEMIREGKFLHYFETYKSAGQGRPLHYDAIREYMIQHWDAREVHGMEADDKLTIQHTKAYDWAYDQPCPAGDISRKLKDTHVIASIDKDLQQVPGWFYDFTAKDKDKDPWTYITKEEADINYYAQWCSGDMVDCIYGVKGVGLTGAKKKVAKIPEDMEGIVRCMYKEWFGKMRTAFDADKLDKLSAMDIYLIQNYEPEEYMEEVRQLVYLLRDEKELEAYGNNELVKSTKARTK